MTDIPRTVWSAWFQGEAQAPPLVRSCLDSWRRHNTRWHMTVVDEDALRTLAPRLRHGSLAELAPPARADLLRLAVLAERGGVWVDATCFATRALDEWLPDLTGSGFFAFADPGRDRPLASWFLAAEPGNYIVETLFEDLARYWTAHDFRNHRRPRLTALLNRAFAINQQTARLWFSPLVLRAAKVYPYFAFHYRFGERCRRDPTFAATWAATPKRTADGPHSLDRHGLREPPSPALVDEIDRRAVPLYKLDRRAGVVPGSSVEHLMRRR